MRVLTITEMDEEVCIICKKSKGGRFVILHVGKKYLAICGRCQKKPSRGWCKNIIGDGESKWVGDE